MALSNNDIIKKLRVALKLRDTDIIDILKLVDYEISKTELSAFFRSEDHPHFRPLKDQILRNFLNGLVIHKRGPMEKKGKVEKKTNPKEKSKNLPPKEFRKPMGFKPNREGDDTSKKTSGLKYRRRGE